MKDISKMVRIQKFFSDNAIMSRRAAEAAVVAGRVTVNGVQAKIGQSVDPEHDAIMLDGKPVAKAPPQKTYIMLNKPRGYVTTLSDERGRRTVAELVADCGARVYPVGRLDMDSEGLLIMTNDGDLTLRLTHPRHEIPKIYLVTLAGEITEDKLNALRSVRKLDGYTLAPIGVRVAEHRREGTVVEFTLHEGRNRQIRRMCSLCDLRVIRLMRVSIGSLTLDGLKVGHWRPLTQSQIDYLYGKEN